MLPIKKIYIDSRWKTPNSKSDSDFTVQLPQNYYMPKNTVFFIDHVCLPVSWYSVQKGRNNIFYYALGPSALQTVEIPEGNYKADTLVGELIRPMNILYPNSVTGKYNVELNSIQIEPKSDGVSLFIPTDEDLIKIHGKSLPLYSINSILRNFANNQTYNKEYPFISDYVDFYPIRNLYLVSDNLGNHNTIALNGTTNIIKQIVINAPYNQLVVDNQVLGIDYLDCSGQNLNLLKFKLVDSFGNVIDLNGNHWSFSIVFSILPEEN